MELVHRRLLKHGANPKTKTAKGTSVLMRVGHSMAKPQAHFGLNLIKLSSPHHT